jgi:hypothetical protein
MDDFLLGGILMSIGTLMFILTIISAYVILRRTGLSVWWLPLAFFWPFGLWFLATRKWPSLNPPVA